MSESPIDLTLPVTLGFPGGTVELHDATTVVLSSEREPAPQWQLVLFNWLQESGRAATDSSTPLSSAPLAFNDAADAAAVFMLAGWAAHAPESSMQRIGTVIFSEEGLAHHAGPPDTVVPGLGLFTLCEEDGESRLLNAPYFPHPAAKAHGAWLLLHKPHREPPADGVIATGTSGDVGWTAWNDRPELSSQLALTDSSHEDGDRSTPAPPAGPEDAAITARLSEMENELREEIDAGEQQAVPALQTRDASEETKDALQREPTAFARQADVGETSERLSRLVSGLPAFAPDRRIALSLVCECSDAARAKAILGLLALEGERLRAADGSLNIIVTVANRQRARALLASFAAVPSARLENAALAGS